MFALSAKGIYGVTAMAELGMRFQGGPVQIREIAEMHAIPQHYLEQILVLLKKAGLVESFRGSQGGYALARRPAEIRVLDILACLEGPLEMVPGDRGGESLAFFWKDLQARIRGLLDVSLDELILRKQREDRRFTYTI